jgi:hypothetical protein
MRACDVINCIDRWLFRSLRGFRYDNTSFELDEDVSDDNDDHECRGHGIYTRTTNVPLSHTEAEPYNVMYC